MATRNLKLNIEAKRFIVRALARRTRHADIVTQLEARFGVHVHKRAIAHYTRHNTRLDEELKSLYEREVAAYSEETSRRVDELMAATRQRREREREQGRAAL